MPQRTLRANARTMPIASLTADTALRRAFDLFGPRGPDPLLAPVGKRDPRPRQDGGAALVRVLELA